MTRESYAADAAERKEVRSDSDEWKRGESLRVRLAYEQLYAEKLARQLRQVTSSRLWRAAQWLRRLAGREAFKPDLERPIPGANVLASGQMAEIFGEIYRSNHWQGSASHSGTGSDLEQTATIRAVLPELIQRFAITSLLDIPCGDFHWMRELELDIDYTGADVVANLIAENNARYGNARRHFVVLDVANDPLPRVDLVFCRDLLVHFSFDDALKTLSNLKASGSHWLLTTTFPECKENEEIRTGHWRVLNLQLPPFSFPPPQQLINEHCTERGIDTRSGGFSPVPLLGGAVRKTAERTSWSDKSLGLWDLTDL